MGRYIHYEPLLLLLLLLAVVVVTIQATPTLSSRSTQHFKNAGGKRKKRKSEKKGKRGGETPACERWRSSGLSPPCMQKILSSMTAATGMQLKRSENVRQSLTEYRRLHSS